MRITAKIATAGKAGLSRFPVANRTIDECLDEHGRLDIAKALDALNCDQITHSSTDDLRVYAFTLEYLHQQRNVVERMSATLGSDARCVNERNQTSPHTECKTAADRSCEKKMMRDRIAYVRTDVYAKDGYILVRIDVQNPKGIVGSVDEFAHDYAVLCARCALYIANSVKGKHGREAVRVVAGDGCPNLIEEAMEMERLEDERRANEADKAKRDACPHRIHSGGIDYCSPICPNCKFYEKGKCKEIEE